ncbi:tetratricopeptide repeat protein [uncultured Sulfitobacter sp.]|uniref:tetratricopeptide repeat protein n=1 Tax=uncultured Sulfitobacter sp. TaxID=191468 RepID=UPI00260D20ED|nr:tetratricopeptide repeat protein [uncultured Sulfitobacter sp.]
MEAALAILTEYAVELGALGGLVGVLTAVWAVITKAFSKPKPVALARETVEQIKPQVAKDGPSFTVPEFIRLRRELKADLEAELAQAEVGETQQLRARIAELESQIANPEASLKEAQKRIRDLEEILERAGNEIGGDRIAEARAALEQGDYSIADELFAEIEAREQMAVENSARAAFGRGEVAEAEVRWADAANHYARAASFSATYDHLYNASNFALKTGDFAAGLRFAQEMECKARAEGDKSNLSRALDRAATAFQNNGDYPAAEPLFREALALADELEGKESESCANGLNNLALLLKTTGRYEEAEPLYREALEITRKILGEAHPVYANGLNNLAGLLDATGRYEEAEPLYREALEIDRKTVGEVHPVYAIRLNNLANLLFATGRYEEAEPLYREALEIDRKTLGEAHPYYAIDLNNLAGLLEATGRYEEAEPLYREALEITRKTLGEAHPDYATRLNNLAKLLEATGRYEEAEPLLREALAVFEAALGADHPTTVAVAKNLEEFLAKRP